MGLDHNAPNRVCRRRIDGFRLTNKVAASHVLEQWRHFQHASVVNLLDLVLSTDADDANGTHATRHTPHALRLSPAWAIVMMMMITILLITKMW
jgi:hypothetical protein